MIKRRTFVTHNTQKKYLKLVLLAMLGPALVIGGCLYYLIWETVARELLIPELIAQALFPAYHRVNGILLFSLPFVFGGIFFFAARLAHRIGGPLYRIEHELDEMARTKDFSKKLRIRPKDELQPLVKKINEVLRAAREKK